MAKREVIWTETAAKQRREILRYWTVRNGSTSYAEKLIKLTAVRIKVISTHPESYKMTIYPETRIAAMGHFSILYKFNPNQVIITAFWDNRQDPEKLLAIINP
ncbi:type II toxin-antitoxin system RelE/ParE family toxin [Mucilaginibacter sp. X5P1]|uniref:type II toxin-antitoxin system RelE/ParE family toxin n=1 Tax=Mucilaginibacter sp. X5P1 TaxID=2723088 RepID=UPI00161EBF54|nr:plasmid stabilization system protein ParE [Mucilaginibacter sp. X5P1]